LARISNLTFADCERVKLIATLPLALSDAELRLPPLPDQTMYCPPEALESLCTENGEKLLCPERLSSST